jgi:hypothetical protein
MEEQTARLTSLHINSSDKNWKHVSITDTKKGKSVVATSDMKPSTTILQERPFIRELNLAYKGMFCEMCFKELFDKKTACRKSCEWDIQYCSTACEEEGWRSSHEKLCGFPDLQYELEEDLLLAFQAYIKCKALKYSKLIKYQSQS